MLHVTEHMLPHIWCREFDSSYIESMYAYLFKENIECYSYLRVANSEHCHTVSGATACFAKKNYIKIIIIKSINID